MPPRCQSICLTFPSHDESLIFLERCRGLGLTSIQLREDEMHTRIGSHNEAMVELDHLFLSMKFEMEKAVLNGDLESFEVLSLTSAIQALSCTAGGLPAAAFRLFVTTLQGLQPVFYRRRKHSGRSSVAEDAGLSLEKQLINATKYYSVKTSPTMTPFLQPSNVII